MSRIVISLAHIVILALFLSNDTHIKAKCILRASKIQDTKCSGHNKQANNAKKLVLRVDKAQRQMYRGVQNGLHKTY